MPTSRRDDKPKYPPIDKLKAVILERKLTMGFTYDDFAVSANTTPTYIRKMFSKMHSSQWNPEIKESICKKCGIGIKMSIVDLYDMERTNNIRK